MRTKLVNTAADVIHRALQRCETSAGIAIALDSAGLLMSPETAAELAVLREDIATADDDVLAAQRHNDATCEAVKERDKLRAEVDHLREYNAWLRQSLANGEKVVTARDARIAELEAAQQRVRHALTPRWDLAPDAQGVVTTALSDPDHVHEYQHFGPHAGSRCVSCNQPETAEAEGPTADGGERPLLDPRSFDRPGQRAAARMLNAEAGER